MVVVKIKHMNYNGSLNSNAYYFKTHDPVGINDVIYCDTTHGLAVGKVIEIYYTLDELLAVDDLPKLSELKSCRFNVF